MSCHHTLVSHQQCLCRCVGLSCCKNVAAARHSNFISFCKSLQAVDVSQYTEQLSIVTSQTEVLPKAILMSLTYSPGASTEARQQLDIQFCTHVLLIQIADGRSSTTAWVKKVCLVLLGNHHASATQPVRFFWQSPDWSCICRLWWWSTSPC